MKVCKVQQLDINRGRVMDMCLDDVFAHARSENES